jgi:DNA-binding NarL/FixJ family response regulator
MTRGTLVVSRAVKLHQHYKKRLEQLGFDGVMVTGVEKDGLNMLINELKPRIVMIGSAFYQAATPYMAGELHRLFPKLNIAAISVYDYPLNLAAWFIWHGVRSYVSLWEGYEEFHRGLQIVREGRQYISPLVLNVLERFHEWPETKTRISKREKECLVLLCCGFVPERIGDVLYISRKSVNKILGRLYNMFHVHCREEMVALAWKMKMVTEDDIQFYDRKPMPVELPEWARVKLRINQMRNEQ